MCIEVTPVSAEDWNRAADVLAHCGWLRLPDFLSQGLANELANVCTHGWHPLPPEEGVVRQNGFGSYVAYSDADPLVRHVGDALIDSLSPVLAETGFPALPSFNEASWTRYPRGVGHITAHRDPSAYEGIIAVFTLIGEATFRVWDEPAGSKKEW